MATRMVQPNRGAVVEVLDLPHEQDRNESAIVPASKLPHRQQVHPLLLLPLDVVIEAVVVVVEAMVDPITNSVPHKSHKPLLPRFLWVSRLLFQQMTMMIRLTLLRMTVTGWIVAAVATTITSREN